MAREKSTDEVQLNVTAMLDMAFQLLAFFVLTFKLPSEQGFLSHMPPAKPVIVTEEPETGNDNVKLAKAAAAGVTTLRIDLFSASGELDRIAIDGHPADSLNDLQQKMTTMLDDPKTPIEQIVVQAGDRLNYATVMQVVGFCSEHEKPAANSSKFKELFKLRLVAMGDGSE